MFAWLADAAAGTQKTAMVIDEFHGQDALMDQLLFAVYVFEQQVEKSCALGEPGIDEFPVVARDEEGNIVEFPGAVEAIGIAVDIIGDAVFAEEAQGILVAGAHFFFAELGIGLEKGFPVGLHSSVFTDQFPEGSVPVMVSTENGVFQHVRH